jgi:hypothetical protein
VPHILISYRRNDSDAITGRIRDRVAGHYGDHSVFMDIDSIPFGLDFRKQVQEALQQNDVVLAIIGPQWTGIGVDGAARIQEESDPVRIEVQTALKRGIPTIPVLVGEATMPKPTDLPESLKELPFLNACEVSAGRDFNQHMDRLLRSIDRILEIEAVRRAQESAPQPAPAAQTNSPQRSGTRAAGPTEPPLLKIGLSRLMERMGLRFGDQRLEDNFQAAFRDRCYSTGQISMMSGIVAWVVLGMTDVLSGSEGLQSTQFRFMVAAPLMLIFFALSFTRMARQHWQQFFAIFAGVGVTCMYVALILVGTETWFHVEQATMSFMLFIALVGLAPFTTAYTAGVGILIVLTHAYYVITYPQLPRTHALFYSLFVAGAYAIACIGAWTRETLLRSAFLTKGNFVFSAKNH